MQKHVDDFLTHVAARQVEERHRRHLQVRLAAAVDFASAKVLGDLADPSVMDRFVLHLNEVHNLASKTIHDYCAALRQFGTWLQNERRWPSNMFAGLKTPPVRPTARRRALTVDELATLIRKAVERSPQMFHQSHMRPGMCPALRVQIRLVSCERCSTRSWPTRVCG